jgi:hypothetical protein
MMNRNNSDIWLNKHDLPLSNKLSSEKNKLFLTILVIWVKFMISGRSVTGKFAAAGNRRLPRYSLLGVSGWWSLRVE